MAHIFKRYPFDETNEKHIALRNHVEKLQLTPLNEVTINENSKIGLLVNLNQYNNGIYVLFEDNYSQLMVLEPNTLNNDKLTRELSEQIINHLYSYDFTGIEPYNFIRMFSNIIEEVISESYANVFYPAKTAAKDIYKQRYTEIFLRHLVAYNDRINVVDEEYVNMEPRLLHIKLEEELKKVTENAKNSTQE